MERETVPDTEDYILLDKNRHGYGSILGSIRVYTANSGTNTKYTGYTGIWAFAELQAGSLQYNWFLPSSETQWKTTIIRKWIPCRAAKQREVFSAAASGR